MGDQEWIDTDELDLRVLSELKDKIIASNYRIDKSDLAAYGQIELRDGNKAFILSYLDEKCFYVSEDKKNIQFDDTIFASTYNELSGKSSLVILVFHGTRYTLNSIIEKFPKFNLTLWAHEQSNLENVSENPVIVGGGADGEYIKRIEILKESDNYKFKVNSIPVSANIQGDPKINKRINKFKVADKSAKGQE